MRDGGGAGSGVKAAARARKGEAGESRKFLRAALAQHPDDLDLNRRYVYLVIERGRPDRAGDAVIAFAERFPRDPSLPAVFEALLARDRKKAREVALRLSDRFGEDPTIACLAGERLLETPGNQDRALALCRRGLQGPDLNAAAFRLVAQVLHLGGLEDAVAWTTRMKAEAGRASPEVQAQFRNLLRNQLEAGHGAVELHRGPAGADTVLFVFCGLKNQPGVTSEEFEALMEGLPVHWVLLRDPLMLMYLKGIPQLGPDLASTARALGRMADDLGARRRLCFGNSAGGYAALRYGHAMDADGVLGVVAPTYGTEDSMRADGRAAAVVGRLLSQVRHEVLDMRELLLARENPLRTHLYYGTGMANDAAFALHMADVPGVTLHPVDYDQHGLIQHLATLGVARTMLEAFILDAPPPGPGTAGGRPGARGAQ